MERDLTRLTLKERIAEAWWNITSFRRPRTIRIDDHRISTRFRSRSQELRYNQQTEEKLGTLVAKYVRFNPVEDELK